MREPPQTRHVMRDLRLDPGPGQDPAFSLEIRDLCLQGLADREVGATLLAAGTAVGRSPISCRTSPTTSRSSVQGER